MSATGGFVSRFALALALVIFVLGWALASGSYGASTLVIASALTLSALVVSPSTATAKAVIAVLVLGWAPALIVLAVAGLRLRVLGIPALVFFVIAAVIAGWSYCGSGWREADGDRAWAARVGRMGDCDAATKALDPNDPMIGP